MTTDDSSSLDSTQDELGDYDDLDAELANLDIDKDYDLWTSFRSRKSIQNSSNDHLSDLDAVVEEEDPSPLELDDIEHWKRRLERDEIFSPRYKPTSSEQQEFQDLVQFLGMAKKGLFDNRRDDHWKELVFEDQDKPKNNIILKRGPVLVQNKERELILLTHGFVLAQVLEPPKNAFSRMFIPRSYEQCDVYNHVEHIRSIPIMKDVVVEVKEDELPEEEGVEVTHDEVQQQQVEEEQQDEQEQDTAEDHEDGEEVAVSEENVKEQVAPKDSASDENVQEEESPEENLQDKVTVVVKEEQNEVIPEENARDEASNDNNDDGLVEGKEEESKDADNENAAMKGKENLDNVVKHENDVPKCDEDEAVEGVNDDGEEDAGSEEKGDEDEEQQKKEEEQDDDDVSSGPEDEPVDANEPSDEKSEPKEKEKKFVTIQEERHCFVIKTESNEFFMECATLQHKGAWLEAWERVLVQTRSRQRDVVRERGWQHALVQTSLYSASVTGLDDLCCDEWLTTKDELDQYNSLSPLHYAVMVNHMHIMDYLLSSGADPEVKDADGRTPMYYAQREGFSGAKLLLQEYGAQKSRLCEVEERGELFQGAHAAEESKAASSPGGGKTSNHSSSLDSSRPKTDGDLQSHQKAATKAHGAMSDAMNHLKIRGERINEMSDKANVLTEGTSTMADLAKQMKNKAKKKKWYQL